MRSRINPWFVGAALFCALVWSAAGLTTAHLAAIYDARGPAGFRHALLVRLDHHVDRLRSVVTGVDRA